MINLIRNELYKIFHKKGIYIVLLVGVAYALLTNYIYKEIDFYDIADTYDEYVKEMEESGDIHNEEYVNSKADQKYREFAESFSKDSWQRYVLLYNDNSYNYQIRNAYYDILAYEVGLNKDEETHTKAVKDLDQLTTEIENMDWKDYALKEKEMYSSSEELNSYEKARLEGVDLRLKYNIVYADDEYNNILDEYITNRETELDYASQDQDELKGYNKENYQRAKEGAQIALYKIENNITNISENSSNAILSNFYQEYSIILIVMIVLVSGSIVSEEFSKGTIKLLLVKPYSRTKILLSKFITTIIMILFSIVSMFIIQLVIGGIFFGFDSMSIPIVIFDNAINAVREINVYQYFLYLTIAILPQYILLSTLAFSLSTIFLNTALANTLTIMGSFGSDIINLIAQEFEIDILKFFVTLNWDFTPYLFGGVSPYKGITLPFSICICIAYMLIMLVTTFIVFKKKNIKNV